MSQINLTHDDLLDMMSRFLEAVGGHYPRFAGDAGAYVLREVPALHGYSIHRLAPNGNLGCAGFYQGCYQLDELYYALEAVVGVTEMLKREKRRVQRRATEKRVA